MFIYLNIFYLEWFMKLATCGRKLIDWNTKQVVKEIPSNIPLVHLMAFGTQDAKKLARYVSKISCETCTCFCSTNETCLSEIHKLRPEWNLGITGTFPPIHNVYDFVHIERSMDCPEIRRAFSLYKII
jgi:hypothetical protein